MSHETAADAERNFKVHIFKSMGGRGEQQRNEELKTQKVRNCNYCIKYRNLMAIMGQNAVSSLDRIPVLINGRRGGT